MEKEKQEQTFRLIQKYYHQIEPLEEIFSFWDFVWWRERWRLEPKYERSNIKLPAFHVRSAICLFMMTHTEHISFPTVFNEKHKDFEGALIESTFFQVIEYKMKKRRGFTAYQFEKVKVWNRHDFLPFFNMRFVPD